MGFIEKSLSEGSNYTIFTVDGSITPDDLLATVTEFLSGSPTLLVLWDLRAGRLAHVTGDKFREFVEKTRPLTHSRASGRTAIVCASDVDFGNSRMFQMLAEVHDIPIDFCVFRELAPAVAWLTANRS